MRSIDAGKNVLERRYKAQAVGQIGGAIVTVESHGYDQYRVVNRDTGQPFEPVLDKPWGTDLIAVGEYLEHPAVCFAKYQGDIEVMDVRYGVAVLIRKSFDFPIRTLVVGEVEGELIVAAGNDTEADGGYVRIRQTILMEDDETHRAVAYGKRILGLGLAGSRLVVLAEGIGAIDPFTLEIVASSPDDGATIQLLNGEWGVPTTMVEDPPSDRRSITLSTDRPLHWPVRAEAWNRINGKLRQARGSYFGTVWILDNERREVVYGPFSGVKRTSTVWTRSKMVAEAVRGVALGSWEGRGVVAVAYSRRATVFDLETGNELGSPETQSSDIVVVALGEIAGRPILATGSGGGAVTVWEGTSMKRLASIWLDTGVTGIWLGGAFLVVRTADNRFHVFDVILGA